MALLLTSPPSLSSKTPKPSLLFSLLRPSKTHTLFSSLLSKTPKFPTLRRSAAASTGGDSSPNDGAPAGVSDEWGEKGEPETEPPTKFPDVDPPKDEDEWGVSAGRKPAAVVDEWGERAELETDPPTRLSDADPATDEDEWGTVRVGFGNDYGNGSAGGAEVVDDKLMELKRCLVDTVYGSDLGFRASEEVRAEVLELVSQLEAANPTPAPTEATAVLDGNWVLVYTAFSELLPLLAAGTTPLFKVKQICQAINTSSLTIENSTTLSGPFGSFSFSASAAFEVRTPTRIQVEFKEGTLQPPEIKSSIDLPENVDIFGQKITLSPAQQFLNPLREAVASIARTISGQPPIKLPIPGERTKSWLLITYLDKDFRISRGDGGLFVLAKEGSPLLDM
ncbi:LOW QUALITY PROTEIN: plastoglobulin-1, chloroplastic-like [Actinidia eriantha]|uniref:LOW QUALITY PROTEIN: plastoglobulin-1, chloroplastic-like n=1 Tax=Actinidia eriantha TaxID=165200 RepID=UPI002589E086|nr:LOW QUALITY PROTEIN: plastoglobulin-1, chloroplastic-like [Actinidia eriantha]